MKKIAIILILFLIILSGVESQNDFSLLNYFSGEYIAYSSEDAEGAVNLGFCYMNSKPIKQDIVGESIKLKNFELGAALQKLNARVVKTEYLDDGTTVVYAYSLLIKDNVEVFGERVNLQVALRDEETIIGWPLILGSF